MSIRHSARPRHRTLAVTSVLALMIALLTAVGAQQARAATGCHPYPDVTAANPACENIAWLKGKKITKPADGLYHPLAGVSRQAMAAFLYRITYPSQASPRCSWVPWKPFPDVPHSNPFCGYIAWAMANSLVHGYANGHYGPSNPVTRGAMAAYLYRLVNPGRRAPHCTSKPFPDVPTDDPFCGVITWVKRHHITYGLPTGSYGTKLPVTRQAMASFLRRISSIDHYRGSVSGTVRGLGYPVKGVVVTLYSTQGTVYFGRLHTTGASGHYEFTGLRTGRYRVCFDARNAQVRRPGYRYFSQCYGRTVWYPATPWPTWGLGPFAPDSSDLTPVNVLPNHAVTGIDASLVAYRPAS